MFGQLLLTTYLPGEEGVKDMGQVPLVGMATILSNEEHRWNSIGLQVPYYLYWCTLSDFAVMLILSAGW